MTKLKTILVALMATMTMAMAGGNIVPVQTIEVAPVTKDFYVGGAITAVQTYENGSSNWFSDTLSSETGYGIQGQVGYVVYRSGDFSTAIEGRVGKTVGNYGMDEFDFDGDVSLLTYSALVKPQYNFGDFGVYALVGYGTSKFTDGDFTARENGLVWGGGAEYAINDTWAVFADYTVNPVFEDAGYPDIENDIMALGVNYKF